MENKVKLCRLKRFLNFFQSAIPSRNEKKCDSTSPLNAPVSKNELLFRRFSGFNNCPSGNSKHGDEDEPGALVE
jgi:hypothetical protein